MEVKYDKIGIGYNLTRKADRHLTQRLHAHLNPVSKGRYLDIGCGTGNYTAALHEVGYEFIGIDPSEKMLNIAKRRNPEIDWRLGSAENTQLPDRYVNGIVGSLTIHHWNNLRRAFSELERILKPNGRIVIFTSTPKQMEVYWLNHYFPKMLFASIKQMPALESVQTAMEFAGIEAITTEKYFIQPDLQDNFLYCGKHNPEVYFEEQIRNGISSFSSLANRKEVQSGLADLRKDIESGKISQIIKSYENDLGDYLFVIGSTH